MTHTSTGSLVIVRASGGPIRSRAIKPTDPSPITGLSAWAMSILKCSELLLLGRVTPFGCLPSIAGGHLLRTVAGCAR